MNALQKIFRDNYEIIQYTFHPRATAMSFKLIKCPHHHCIFTIDEELRHFFLEDRSLLNCLFSSVRSVVLNMFYKAN